MSPRTARTRNKQKSHAVVRVNEHITRQTRCHAIAGRTARCTLCMGALKIFGSPWLQSRLHFQKLLTGTARTRNKQKSHADISLDPHLHTLQCVIYCCMISTTPDVTLLTVDPDNMISHLYQGAGKWLRKKTQNSKI